MIVFFISIFPFALLLIPAFFKYKKRKEDNFYADKIFYLDWDGKILAPIPSKFGYKAVRKVGKIYVDSFYLIPKQKTYNTGFWECWGNFHKDFDPYTECGFWDSYNSDVSLEDSITENIKEFATQLNFIEILKEDDKPLEKIKDWDIKWKFLIGYEDVKKNTRWHFLYAFISARKKKVQFELENKNPTINIFLRREGTENYDFIRFQDYLNEILNKLIKNDNVNFFA